MAYAQGAAIVTSICAHRYNFSLFGLWISYQFNIASGASIILLAGISYMFATFKKKVNSLFERRE
jgi:ABC-type Mn2+/Zn2+ transport system permease subunit